MLSTPASESALISLVQQHNQHSLIWFSQLWNIAVSACHNSLVNAFYNWWGASLLECHRWPLCLLQLGGLFFSSFFSCDRQAIVHCEYEFATECFLSFAALVVNRLRNRQAVKQRTWQRRWLTSTMNGIAHLYCYTTCCCALLLLLEDLSKLLVFLSSYLNQIKLK